MTTDNEIVIEDYYVVDQDGFYTAMVHSLRLTAGTTSTVAFQMQIGIGVWAQVMLTAFIRRYCQARLKRESLPL